MPSNEAISILGMVGGMDAIVKGILALLIVASLLTWTVFVAKCIEMSGVRVRLRRDLARLAQATSLEHLRDLSSDAATLLTDGIRIEVARAGDLRLPPCSEGLKERVTVLLPGIEAQLARRASRGLGIVASVGATAPFIGLFGTVWGIMNSFASIAHTQATSLAVVAPGIAEALLTTAMGLAAAVPAVLIYNGFVRYIAGYRALLADVSNAAACLLSLDLQRIQLASTTSPGLPEKGALGL
jgi:biopolymer transport protein ExbB